MQRTESLSMKFGAPSLHRPWLSTFRETKRRHLDNLLSVSRPRRLGGQKRVMATAPHEVRQALENHYAPIEEFADAVVAHAAISSNPSHRLNFTDLARSLTSEPPVD